jgi:hypothetical protein
MKKFATAAAPALAQNGPNPEYPWPPESPAHAPVSFEFALWLQLTQTGSGHQFFQMVGTAIRQFPIYA